MLLLKWGCCCAVVLYPCCVLYPCEKGQESLLVWLLYMALQWLWLPSDSAQWGVWAIVTHWGVLSRGDLLHHPILRGPPVWRWNGCVEFQASDLNLYSFALGEKSIAARISSVSAILGSALWWPLWRAFLARLSLRANMKNFSAEIFTGLWGVWKETGCLCAVWES